MGVAQTIAKVARLRESLIGNSVLTLLNTVTGVAITLVMSPYIVAEIGLGGYGYWSIIQALLQYLQIADGSLPTVALRHVAKALAANDVAALREAVATAAVALAAMGTVITAVAVAVPLLLPNGLTKHLPVGWAASATLAGISLGITMAGSAFAAVTRGHERWDVDTGINVLGQFAQAGVTVGVLSAGYGITGLGWAAIGNSVVYSTGYIVFAYRSGAIGRKGFRPRRDLLVELRQQGVPLQVVGLVGATNAQADRLMLLPFAHLSFIGAYALGSRIAATLRGFAMAGFGPLFARIAVLDSLEGREAVRALYSAWFRGLCRYVVPMLLAGYLAAFPAVLAWLGAGYTISATGAVVLGVGYAINVATGPGTLTAIACGRAELDRDYNLIGLAINILLSGLLGVLLGPWGVVAATTAGLIVSSFWLIWRVDVFLDIKVGVATLADRRVWLSSVGCLLLGAVTIALTQLVAPSTRPVNLLIAAICGLAGASWVCRDLARPEALRAAIRSRFVDFPGGNVTAGRSDEEPRVAAAPAVESDGQSG